MDIKDTVLNRRAIKHYDPDHKMPPETRRELLELALQSPTSFNVQHWRIVDVQDSNLRAKVREAAWGQAQVTDASLLLVLCADIKAWEKRPERYWENASDAAREMMVPMIKQFYEGKEELQRDEAMRSVGIIAQTIMLAAQGLGYDSCPMIGFDPVKVGEIINLPKDHVIGMLVVVGKRTKDAWPKPGQLPLEEVCKIDTF